MSQADLTVSGGLATFTFTNDVGTSSSITDIYFRKTLETYVDFSSVAITNIFPEDAYGTPLAEIPMMEGIRNYDDIPLVITLAGWSAAEAWVARRSLIATLRSSSGS